MSSFHFTARINSKSFPWAAYAAYTKGTYPNFCNARVNQYAALLPGGPTWKKSRLNWKLKISDTAHNTDIIQSQARDTRHCRMQEVNSLCADSLRGKYCIVFIQHNTAI